MGEKGRAGTGLVSHKCIVFTIKFCYNSGWHYMFFFAFVTLLMILIPEAFICKLPFSSSTKMEDTLFVW